MQNKIDAFRKSQALISAKLDKIGIQNKAKKNFMMRIIFLFMGFSGRYNFTNMARYGEYTEKTYRNNFQKAFDFLSFNKEIILDACSSERIIAFDPSYIPKSGKQTEHLGTFWSGVSGKALRGLEIGGFAVVDIKNNTAMSLEAVQTPSVKELKKEDKTLVNHYACLVIERKEILESLSKYLVVDGYFSKKNYINSITKETHLHIISKMRKDANLHYLYLGKRTGKEGRPKVKDGKIDMKNINKKRFKLAFANQNVKVYQVLVYSISLKRKVNLAYVEFWNGDKYTGKYAVLFSTDLTLSGERIYLYYKSRFQIEFLFRDAKQFAGLTQVQARSKEKLHFHFNISLTSVSTAKAIYYLPLETHQQTSFSMSDIKTLHLNKIIADRIFSNLGLDHSLKKIDQIYWDALSIGKIAS